MQTNLSAKLLTQLLKQWVEIESQRVEDIRQSQENTRESMSKNFPMLHLLSGPYGGFRSEILELAREWTKILPYIDATAVPSRYSLVLVELLELKESQESDNA